MKLNLGVESGLKWTSTLKNNHDFQLFHKVTKNLYQFLNRMTTEYCLKIKKRSGINKSKKLNIKLMSLL